MRLVENRLFGATGGAPRHDMGKPTRDIGSTLSQFRSAAAPVATSRTRVPQDVKPTKRVRFAEHPTEESVDGSPIAMASRMPGNPEALRASQCLVEHGDSMPACTIRYQLLMCLNLNRDEALVSDGSEELLRKAFLKVDALPGKATCVPGDYCYDVLSVFLDVVEQKRPALLSAD